MWTHYATILERSAVAVAPRVLENPIQVERYISRDRCKGTRSWGGIRTLSFLRDLES
jgi:hypothetical protein